MTRDHSTPVVLAVLLTIRTACFAQPGAWERIGVIEPGKNMRVELQSGKSMKGKMQAWSPEGLTLRQGRTNASHIGRTDVAKVWLLVGKSRARKASWAGLIAGGAGAGLMGAACAASWTCDIPPAAMAAGGAVWFGGIAAGIAALFPQHKVAIYDVNAPPPPVRIIPAGR